MLFREARRHKRRARRSKRKLALINKTIKDLQKPLPFKVGVPFNMPKTHLMQLRMLGELGRRYG